MVNVGKYTSPMDPMSKGQNDGMMMVTKLGVFFVEGRFAVEPFLGVKEK